jgi:DNA-binding response OmpR family regulator
MYTTKGKNILIVDDDDDLTNLYETFLKYDGYKVDALLILSTLCILLKKLYTILLYLI